MGHFVQGGARNTQYARRPCWSRTVRMVVGKRGQAALGEGGSEAVDSRRRKGTWQEQDGVLHGPVAWKAM